MSKSLHSSFESRLSPWSRFIGRFIGDPIRAECHVESMRQTGGAKIRRSEVISPVTQRALTDPNPTEEHASGHNPRLSGCDEMSTEPNTPDF